VTGAVGLSVGVIHYGEVIDHDHFGYRDVDQKIAPDVNSTYHIGSMSKVMVAASFGSLVHQRKLN
jgi:CubicO group peptidase (beta-lactamase class C family)